MNLPNKLSILRVLLIPIIVIMLYINTPTARVFALVFYIIAALTDLADGYIARTKNIATDFGKFIDPVADKLLVICTLCMLIELGELPAYVLIIIICRELAVDGLRLVAASQQIVIAASKYGKYKTILQMLATIFYLSNNMLFDNFPINKMLMVFAVIMTILSGVDYFMKNIKSIKGI